MIKINDTHVKERLGIKNDAFYKWKKRDPEAVMLIKKGLLYEAIENGTVADQLIKKDNVRK